MGSWLADQARVVAFSLLVLALKAIALPATFLILTSLSIDSRRDTMSDRDGQ